MMLVVLNKSAATGWAAHWHSGLGRSRRRMSVGGAAATHGQSHGPLSIGGNRRERRKLLRPSQHRSPHCKEQKNRGRGNYETRSLRLDAQRQ